MKLEKHEIDATIIRYGDEGHTFCIILKGQVSVMIPTIANDSADEDEE